MSVQEWYDEECALCNCYHCGDYFCIQCLIGYALAAGADREALIELLKRRNIVVDDYDLEAALSTKGRLLRETNKRTRL